MTRFAILGVIVALLLATSASSAANKPPATEREKIEALLKHLEGLTDAKFIRNGEQYDSTTAANFLRRKWKANEAKIKTAKDFIDIAASFSSTSGKPYLIRFKDGKETKSAEYLSKQLSQFESSN